LIIICKLYADNLYVRNTYLSAGVELRALLMLRMCSTTELPAQDLVALISTVIYACICFLFIPTESWLVCQHIILTLSMFKILRFSVMV
jgi:hypothetical protein